MSSVTGYTKEKIDAMFAGIPLIWAPNTVYPVGALVINPNGDIVKRVTAGISGANYDADAVNWALSPTFASKANIYAALSKNPDNLVTGAIAVDANNLVTSAAVVWPDGTPGTLTITSRDANNAVLAYNITYGSPVTKTYTQPTITRNAAGAATNVPQIVVS